MDPRIKRRLVEISEILKAIASPVRLWILQELSDGELCVGDLVPGSGVKEATVSRHLTRMRNAGILDQRKKGTRVYYLLRAETVAAIRENVELILVRKVGKLKTLCRTQTGPLPEGTREHRILRGR